MNYTTDQLTDVFYHIKGNTVSLRYSALMESLYYSPGVDVDVHDDYALIYVKRCNIKSECKAEFDATQDSAQKVQIELDKHYIPSQIFINEKTAANQLDILGKSE